MVYRQIQNRENIHGVVVFWVLNIVAAHLLMGKLLLSGEHTISQSSNHITVLKWPPESLDLNSIENIIE